jgi:hypothetical protein
MGGRRDSMGPARGRRSQRTTTAMARRIGRCIDRRLAPGSCSVEQRIDDVGHVHARREHGPAGPGDYDGDGKADPAAYWPSSATWLRLRSGAATRRKHPQWAFQRSAGAHDYDGDGRIDPAVFRPSSGTWFALLSSTIVSALVIGLGAERGRAAADRSAPATSSDARRLSDVDGDGHADSPSSVRRARSGSR